MNRDIGNFRNISDHSEAGKVHLLRDAFSRIPEDDPVANDVEVPYIDISKGVNGYDDDQYFGPIVQALKGNWPSSIKERAKLERLIS